MLIIAGTMVLGRDDGGHDGYSAEGSDPMQVAVFHLDASRMLVTEKVFGFLLAALGVQLALSGLADPGVIHLTSH